MANFKTVSTLDEVCIKQAIDYWLSTKNLQIVGGNVILGQNPDKSFYAEAQVEPLVEE